MVELEASDRTGTVISFFPDAEIFKEGIEFQYDILRNRLRELAFLNGGVSITLTDERQGQEKSEIFHYEGGVISYVEYLDRARTPMFQPPIYMQGRRDSSTVEVALTFNDSYTENVYSFANNIATMEGGTHLAGFRTGVTRAINDYAKRNGILKGGEANLTGEDVREGMTAVISVKLTNPQFEGQTKTKLGNSEIRSMVDAAVSAGLAQYLEEHPQEARAIADKCLGSPDGLVKPPRRRGN